MTTRKKYDIITADIILPRHAGAGALCSREYFQLVRSALSDDGLVLQWNGAEADTTYRMILRTFLSVFPEMTLWADGTLMVGSLKPLTVSRSAYQRRSDAGEFRGLFDWDYATMLESYLAGPPDVKNWVGDGEILTDDKPTIEYFLSLPRGEGPADLSGIVRRPGNVGRRSAQGLRSKGSLRERGLLRSRAPRVAWRRACCAAGRFACARARPSGLAYANPRYATRAWALLARKRALASRSEPSDRRPERLRVSLKMSASVSSARFSD